jgi:hypothetical protein
LIETVHRSLHSLGTTASLVANHGFILHRKYASKIFSRFQFTAVRSISE